MSTIQRIATAAEWNTICWLDEGAGRYTMTLAEMVESGSWTERDIAMLAVAGKNDLLSLSGGAFGGIVKRVRAKIGGSL